MKNKCGKTRKADSPYEIWRTPNGEWTWYVLKKYQTEDNEKKNPYARWFCKVVTPMCPYGEIGDVYVQDVKANAVCIYKDKTIEE